MQYSIIHRACECTLLTRHSVKFTICFHASLSVVRRSSSHFTFSLCFIYFVVRCVALKCALTHIFCSNIFFILSFLRETLKKSAITPYYAMVDFTGCANTIKLCFSIRNYIILFSIFFFKDGFKRTSMFFSSEISREFKKKKILQILIFRHENYYETV